MVLFCLSATAAELYATADGRRYAVHPPAGGTAEASPPVVLILAGNGAAAGDALRDQGWSGTADASGFLAVGLEALPADPATPQQALRNPRIWNDGSAGSSARRRADDAAHVATVLDAVAERYRTDADRVYAVGFADGGAMVQRLAAERPGRFAAAAAVAGHLHSPAPSQRALPLMLVYGGRDPLVPLAGGQVSAPGLSDRNLPSVMTTVNRWIERLDCPAVPAAAIDWPRVERRLWSPCAGGVELAVVLVRDLGHHWPGGGGGLMPARIAGPTSDAFDATAELWAFLRRHRRAAPP